MAMNQERAHDLIAKFRDQRVLVVGDIVLDRYVHGIVERLNPEAPVPVLSVREESETTGGAGSVAKNVAALGARTVLISVVGDDPKASRLEEAARREGYQSRLIRDSSRPTIEKLRYLVNNQQLLRVDREETVDISPELEEKLIEIILREVRDGIDGIIVSDYAKGVITEKIARAVLDMAAEHDVLVAADVKPSRAPYFMGAAFVSPNVKEAHEYLGMNPYEREALSWDALAKGVFRKMCSDVYLTLGPQGMYVFCGGKSGRHVPQDHVVEVFDVTGAGDAAVATLLLAQLAGANETEAAELGNAAGAIVVGKIGTIGVGAEELENMVTHKHG